ncbi:MAG: GEVED domain-containing protein [Acidobacteriota bacterium]|nr:GEVED domain-containing protein [Acidobacteriota bacterium]
MVPPRRVALLIAVTVLALSQSDALVRASDGCSDLFARLRGATGDSLVEAVRGGSLACLNNLQWVSDRPLQIAVSRQSNVLTVANSIPEAMADYDGSGHAGVRQLFLYLRMVQDIHYWCLTRRSCDGYQWNNARTYSMDAGSLVHSAVKAAIDSFVLHPLFRHDGREHFFNLYEVGLNIIYYDMSGLYLNLAENWLNAWNDDYAANPIFHDHMRLMLDIVYWGHRRDDFGRRFGENQGLVHAFRDFALAERWLGTSSQWILQRAVIELGRYTKYQGTTNYRYALPILRSVIATYRNRPEAKDIFLRLLGEIDYNDGGKCGRYGLCDWYVGAGFSANFRAALFTDTMVCPVNACSGDTITLHAQDLEADKLAIACQRLYEEGQAFQSLLGTQCTPVPDDLNNHLDVYVFNDGDACLDMESPAFGRNVDTCSGIYYEHDPTDPNSSAQVVVTEFTADEYPRDPELAIWNFEHEYAHYLDGRFNLHGPYRWWDDSIHWWTEGFAEYLAAEASPFIDVPGCETPYSLTETLLRSGSIPTRYRHRHLAVRFLMQNHRDFVDTLLEYARRGQYAAYTAHMAAEAPKLEGEWQAWLAACEVDPDNSRVAPYCQSRPEFNRYGYIERVVLGSMDHAGSVNFGHRFYDETVTVQVGSTVELRVTASSHVPVSDNVNLVEAWIDWDGNGRFDKRTEQVMYAEVVLTDRNHPVTVSGIVTVPPDAHIGRVRLRVRVQYETGRDREVCDNYESGETQDYDISVTARPDPGDGSEEDEKSRVYPYCLSAPESHLFGLISRVVLGSLDHAGEVNLGHRFYDETVTVQVGSTLELRVTAGEQVPVPGDLNRVEAWIDWDGDRRFDESTEQVMDREVLLTHPNNPVTVSAMVTVPPDAHIGRVRLRVRLQYKTSSSREVCEDYESGETQDYDIFVTAPPSPGDGNGDDNGDGNGDDNGDGNGDGEDPRPDPYCRSVPGYYEYGYISRVALGSLDHAGDINLGHGFYHRTAILQVGSTVKLRVTASVRVPVFEDVNRVEAWIDWNGDRRFDESTEQVMDREVVLTNSSNPVTVAAPVTVPREAQIGRVRLRVRVQYRKSSGQGVCENYESGETQDYEIALTAAPDPGDGSGGEGLQPTRWRDVFVPVILSSAGRGDAFFRSELTLTNRGDEEVTLDYTYRAGRGGGGGAVSDVLEAGGQRIEADALEYLRRLGMPIPGTGDRLGTLRVEVPAAAEVGVLVRTTTAVPEGRAGLAYGGVPEEEGFEKAVYLCGLRQNSRDRSNVAVQNLGTEGSIRVRTTVYSGAIGGSAPRVLKEEELEPGEFHQYSGVLGDVDNGYVKVERVAGDAPFYAYGVINDNFNSDGSFVFPVAESSMAVAGGQTLPVIVETGNFRSELTVTNFSASDKQVDFRFGPSPAGSAVAEFSLELKAGEQRILPNLVNWLRRQEVAGLGRANRHFVRALFATVPNGDMSGIVIGARTGAPDRRGGQYSLFYNGVPYGSASIESAWIYGLQQNAENRSNLALVNTGEIDDSSITLEITVYDGSGESRPRTTSVELGSRQWTQKNGILGRISQGYVQVRKVAGNNPFVAYGVINDGGRPGERSGDGAFLLSQD